MQLIPKPLFNKDEEQHLVATIQVAELKTSGEIRVHLERKCKGNTLDRAVNVFADLKMHETESRNGVLVYLAWEAHRFAIIGDEGIDKVVPADFWDTTKDRMQELFKQGKLLQGIEYGIEQAGEKLQAHFPYDASTDENELDDTISYG